MLQCNSRLCEQVEGFGTMSHSKLNIEGLSGCFSLKKWFGAILFVHTFIFLMSHLSIIGTKLKWKFLNNNVVLIFSC